MEESQMKTKIDHEEINKLINLLDEKNLSHFELEVEGFKIKISRNAQPSPAKEEESSLQPSPQLQRNENPLPLESELQERKNNLHYITSPMVGTFYRAPDPNSPPFVEMGDSVKKNQTLCIIEAMKLMNEIESDVEGTIKAIYVENGKPIEYGQKLFAVQLLS